jgi:hypothetical protein
MCEKLGFCLLLIGVQGGIEDRLKVGGGGGRIGGTLRHDEKKLVWGEREHWVLVFCPTDGD